jgi:hypothetical protein
MAALRVTMAGGSHPAEFDLGDTSRLWIHSYGRPHTKNEDCLNTLSDTQWTLRTMCCLLKIRASGFDKYVPQKPPADNIPFLTTWETTQEQQRPLLFTRCHRNRGSLSIQPRQKKPVSVLAYQSPMPTALPPISSCSSSFSFSSLGSLSLVLPPLRLTTLTRHQSSRAFELLLDFAVAFAFYFFSLHFFSSPFLFSRRSKCQLLVPSRPTPT